MGVGRLYGGAAGSGGGEIPAYTYSGDHLVRLQLYNGVLYAEWELRTSGILTFDQPRTLDAMLVGGGGLQGGNPGNYDSIKSGSGGSAYYNVISGVSGVTSAQMFIGAGGGDTTMTIAGITYSGQRGGSGNGVTAGVGYNGPYRLFDEPGDEYILGYGSNGTNGTTNGLNPPGGAGNGLLLSKIRAGGSYRTGIISHGGIGYGAGQGFYVKQINDGYLYEPYGNPGVVLVRVRLG